MKNNKKYNAILTVYVWLISLIVFANLLIINLKPVLINIISTADLYVPLDADINMMAEPVSSILRSLCKLQVCNYVWVFIHWRIYRGMEFRLFMKNIDNDGLVPLMVRNMLSKYVIPQIITYGMLYGMVMVLGNTAIGYWGRFFAMFMMIHTVVVLIACALNVSMLYRLKKIQQTEIVEE